MTLQQLWYHWLYQDLFVPVWPNIAADIAVAVYVSLKLRAVKIEAKLRHEELLSSHQVLHEKFDALAGRVAGVLRVPKEVVQ